MTRYRANMAILHALTNYLLANPDTRFGQALVNLEIVQVDLISTRGTDPHFEEPEHTLERVTRQLQNLAEQNRSQP